VSTQEHREPFEIGSKIKVTRNAKGEPQWEISVREDVEPGELDRLRKIAVDQYRALEQEFGR
jgi:hypothetical protein